jgi:hypothetical protein
LLPALPPGRCRLHRSRANYDQARFGSAESLFCKWLGGATSIDTPMAASRGSGS